MFYFTGEDLLPFQKTFSEFLRFQSEPPELDVLDTRIYKRSFSCRKYSEEMLKRRLHTADLVDRSQCEHGGGPSFYISRRWVNRFNTFAEPGPIDNEDFVCCHGKLDPLMANRVTQDDFVLFSQSVWEYLRETFKGGPALTSIEPCAICLEKRRALIGKKLAEIAAGDVPLIQGAFAPAELRFEQQQHQQSYPQNPVSPQNHERQQPPPPPSHQQQPPVYQEREQQFRELEADQPLIHQRPQEQESQHEQSQQHPASHEKPQAEEEEEEETMKDEDEVLTIESPDSQNAIDNVSFAIVESNEGFEDLTNDEHFLKVSLLYRRFSRFLPACR